METPKFIHEAPGILEANRIAEIQSLTYVERMYHLFTLMEVSFMIKNAKIESDKTLNLKKLNPENL